ncbi:MAG: GNAT family N-acetyltransferase, partial [Syntrophothermus sp.]
MPAPDYTYRPLAAADADDAFAVFRDSLNDYLARAGQELVPDVNDLNAVFLHFLRHDAPRCWAAVAGDRLVAWTAAIQRGPWWFLSMLFVLPEAQRRGVGGELLRRAMDAGEGVAVRATVTDTLQPLSNDLYARRGMLPREALLTMSGPPRVLRGLAGPPQGDAGLGGLEPEALTAGSVPDLVAVDALVTGLDRTVDHAFYLREGERRGWLFRRAARPVAYVMYRPSGYIGPLACLETGDVAPVLRHALAQLAGLGFEQVKLGVPASCEQAQRVLWDAGLGFGETPGLLLAT